MRKACEFNIRGHNNEGGETCATSVQWYRIEAMYGP